MFDMGFLELLIIGVVGLLVLGPERLPKAARTLGLWLGRIKRSVSSMQREVSAQLEAEELRQKLNEQQKKLDDTVNRVKRDVEGIAEQTPREASGKTGQGAGEGEGRKEEASTAPPEKRLDEALSRARRDTLDDERPERSDAGADKDATPR
jgi:sec-independent protein translocase protein TatB